MKEDAKPKRKALQRGIADIFSAPQGRDDVATTNQIFEKRRSYQANQQETENQQEINDQTNDQLDHNPISDLIFDQKIDDSQIEDQININQSSENKTDYNKNIVEYIPSHDMVQYHHGTVSPHGTVPLESTVPSDGTVSRITSGYFEIPNSVADDIAKTLDPFEWTVYFRLFRLSYGWHKNTCLVGVQSLVNATNICENQVRTTLKKLQQKRLIKVIETVNTKTVKGTLYQVYTVPYSGTVPSESTVPLYDTVPSYGPIKEDHHDDSLKNRSSSKRDDDDLFFTEHFLKTKETYEKATNNRINKTDKEAYKKIKDVSLAVIEETIKVVRQRAETNPNSLNYFIKEILNLSDPKSKTRTQQRKQLERIIKEVQSTYIGSKPSVTDICESVKRRCISEGVVYDNDLFNKIMGF